MLLCLHPHAPPRLALPARPLPRFAAAGPLLTASPPLALLPSPAASLSLPPALLSRSMLPILTVVCLCFLFSLPSALSCLLPAPTHEARLRRKLSRRLFTGFTLGHLVSLWIFSGTAGFLCVFAAMALVAQLEYYQMALRNGVYPTWKLGTLGSLLMYAAAASRALGLRDAIFPLTGTVTIVYLLLRRERKTPPTTMNDISTTFMGIYYFGYMPSFWIRLRSLGPMPPAEVFSLFLPAQALSAPFVSRIIACSADVFSVGALVQWWTMVSIVSADVAAYFTGKRFGRTPLIKVSPRKTWEGLLGGCAAAVAVSASGARLMGWPCAWLTGGAYGLMCAVMALIGDLTVSLLKRSAQVKDTGAILPGHGGLLDRLDSYLLVAAPAYFFVTLLLPLASKLLP
ncbi:hypothetical protein AB1Y20_008336 [Prymnesium parvum]